MDIHFCDICNESVPQTDLERGKAVRIKGRVVCSTCEAAMGGHPEAVRAGGGPAAAQAASGPKGPSLPAAGPAPVRSSSGAMATAGLWVGLVALLCTAGALALGSEVLGRLSGRVGEIERSADREGEILRSRVDAQLAHAENELNELRGTVDETGRVAQENRSIGRGERNELREKLATEVSSLGARLAELSRESDRHGEESDRRALQVAQDLRRLQEDLAYFADRLSALELALEGGAPLAMGGSNGAGMGAGEEPGERRPAWFGLLADLDSPNAGLRWEAVDALGQTGDPAVVPHVVPRLSDVDLFVRMGAARVLGDLGIRDSVGPLIDSLEDPEAAMREAAVVSLRKLTDREFRFDPLAKEAERSKRVRAWRDWWRKESPPEGGA